MAEWLGFFNNFSACFSLGRSHYHQADRGRARHGFCDWFNGCTRQGIWRPLSQGSFHSLHRIIPGTPLLVQLFLIYFGLPDLGITLDRMTAAYIAMSLNSGAYQAEYLRGAIQSIGSGQMMAARAIGLKRSQAIWNIILPQALRMVIPAWSNEPVSLLKSSAVAFLIAVPDLMTQAKSIAAQTYDPIGTYLAAGVVYLVLVFILAAIIGVIEKKVRIPGLELETQRR